MGTLKETRPFKRVTVAQGIVHLDTYRSIKGKCQSVHNTANMAQNDGCGCQMTPEQCCDERNRVREEMIGQIKCLNFAVIELGLYLDTHHDDQKALCLHREYTKQLKELKDQYQRVYGPLSIYYPCKKWRWLEQPWPWEGGRD